MNSNRAKVEKMVNGGYGLARMENGQTLFLQNSLAGETVTFSILEERKNIAFGQTNTIISASPDRISPPCPYYASCGGCNLQHAGYEKQLEIKDNILAELLHGPHIQASTIKKIIPAPEPFGYRQRIRLAVRANEVGFLRFRSDEITPIASCLIAHPAINQVFDEMGGNPISSQLFKIANEIELLFNPETTKVTGVFHLQRKPRPADRKNAVQLVSETEGLERIFFHGEGFSIDGPYTTTKNIGTSKNLSQKIALTASTLSFSLTWEVGGFCQVNLKQNIQIIDYILNNCGTDQNCTVLDLFCGMGNFSIALAHRSTSVTGIEGQGSAIRSAKRNSKNAGLNNTTFHKGPIHPLCDKLVHEEKSYDLVLIDPPRQGAPGLSRQLHQLTNHRLIYISCDPATLARDLGDLTEKGFAISLLQPFDMFPQTHHIETVVILEKN